MQVQKKTFVVAVGIVSILIAILLVTWSTSKSLQKDICLRTIEQSFARFLVEGGLLEKVALSSDWLELSPEIRSTLFHRGSMTTYSECSQFPYLVEGLESDAKELEVRARRTPDGNNIEVKLGGRDRP